MSGAVPLLFPLAGELSRGCPELSGVVVGRLGGWPGTITRLLAAEGAGARRPGRMMGMAGGALLQPAGHRSREPAMSVWARLAGLAKRGRAGTPAGAPVPAEAVQRPPGTPVPGGRSARTTDGPGLLRPPHAARAVPVPVVPAQQWQARRDPPLVYARMSHAERARLLQQRPDCELCRRRPSAAVDHDAKTGRVRGAVCRSCNSWLGSMEAALRVPRRRMQNQAAYLHWRFEAGGMAALAWYLGELSYLGMAEEEFADGLRRLRRLLPLPYVYWTEDDGPVTRDTQWTKIGPLVDVEEADRHHHRLRSAFDNQQTVLTTFEPDDGVNSPFPRGLVKAFAGDARFLFGARPDRMPARTTTAPPGPQRTAVRPPR